MEYNSFQSPILNGPILTRQQNERVEELNDRIYDRFHPDLLQGQSNSLEVNYTPIGVSTKYALFPIVDRRRPESTIEHKKSNLPAYSVSTQFNPGYRGPVSGFQSNVDKETILRNQTFALQKDFAQTTFVPSSKSDLYNTYIVSRPCEQPYPKLFDRSTFDQTVHPNVSQYPEVGNNRFHNATRTQLRGVGN
jgi:hypothetical protein